MRDEIILITGGAGFLGSHFVRHALARGARRVVVVDLLTYAGDLRRLEDVAADPRHVFVRADVASRESIRRVMAEEAPGLVVHFAAESHVTRGEENADLFFRTNLEGTRLLLEAAEEAGVPGFVHVSTDEVYGPAGTGAFREEDKLPGTGRATSAYARSKALADDVALSWPGRLPVVVVRPTNAFGPYQFPEKAFARWVTRALRGDPLLVWGDGLYVRQWLFAADLAEAVELVAGVGEPGRAYNVGPRHEPEIANLDLARWLARHLGLPDAMVQLTAYDRPDHDRRYAVDSARVRALGWRPGDVWSQLAATVEWYRQNTAWWTAHLAAAESIYRDAETVLPPAERSGDRDA